MNDKTINQSLNEIRARIAMGTLSQKELHALVHELNGVVTQVTQTLNALNTQVEHMKRSEAQIWEYRK